MDATPPINEPVQSKQYESIGMLKMGTGPSSYRYDIQFLRGVAVLLVVLYHGFGSLIPHGFLGVDVFFVVSGYLITGIVLRGLETASFSFRAFYLRRARRLLPAAYSTFIASTLISYVMLTSPQWSMYLLQLAGSVTFSANIVLSQMAGYFAPAAETKPLLHIWSLSLEEQFYFVMPFMLWIIGTRLRLPVIIIAAICSVGICLFMVARPDLQSLAFYLLPSRAWELLAGSICAWLAIHRPVAVHKSVQWFALGVIVVVCTIGIDPLHPRGDALAVVIATSVILLGRDNWLPKMALSKPIAIVGDWSYSLYLVHWPLFSFASIAYMGEPPTGVLAALTAMSFVLAWLQYRFVETPFRDGWKAQPRTTWFAFAGMTALVGAVAAPAAYASLTEKPEIQLPPNVGLTGSCDQKGGEWVDLPQCRTSARPTVAVWGDSNAMHLIPGLPQDDLVQITKSACAPIAGVAQITDTYSSAWAKNCISFNQSALRYIVASPTIKFVVMSSPFASSLSNEGQRLIVRGQETTWKPVAVAALADTLKILRAAGKTPLLVAPMPRNDFNPGECQVRTSEGLLIAGRHGCELDRRRMPSWYKDVISELRIAAATSGADLFIPEDAICHESRCPSKIGGTIIYRDAGHLTEAGSRFIVKKLGLVTKLRGG